MMWTNAPVGLLTSLFQSSPSTTKQRGSMSLSVAVRPGAAAGRGTLARVTAEAGTVGRPPG
eukprot:7419830-Alexandrium_andersonii.AAC.1